MTNRYNLAESSCDNVRPPVNDAVFLKKFAVSRHEIDMKKEAFRRWLRERLVTQNRLTMGSIVAMIAIGLVATLIEGVVFFLILWAGFIGSAPLAVLTTVGIQVGILGLTWLGLPKQLPDVQHEAELDGENVLISAAPNMTAVWTYGLGSMESDRTWVERLIGMLTLPQRMCLAAWFTWNRLQQLKGIAVDPCAMVIRLLHKEAERVELKKIVEEVQLADLPSTVRQLSLIDGVVFLTRQSVGLSLAPRLLDDIADWQTRQLKDQGGEL